jgi:hypothetical protein
MRASLPGCVSSLEVLSELMIAKLQRMPFGRKSEKVERQITTLSIIASLERDQPRPQGQNASQRKLRLYGQDRTLTVKASI